MSTPPHPPDETAEDVRAMLRAHHPELTDAQLDAILGGEPVKRRKGYYSPKANWTAGVKGPHGGGSVVPGRLSRRGRRARLRGAQ